MRVFVCENEEASAQQVKVVETFFKYYSRLQDAMALIISIDDEKLIGLVLEEVQLAELVVFLNVDSRETDCIFYMAFVVVAHWSKVEKDDFSLVCFLLGLRGWEVALS